MQKRKNRREYNEHFVEGQHLKLDDLKEEAQDLENQYLFRENIPSYPRPEFHVSHLKHDTNQVGLKGIRRDGGFRARDPMRAQDSRRQTPLLWWSLSVRPDDVTAAETGLLEKTFPDRSQEQVQRQQSFLGRFATSPAFMKSSRLGSYRFTFPLEEVLEAYSEQFCSGAQPVLRVYETVLYKQEVMYSVLVHSPANQELFLKYPLLTDDPNAVCAFKDGRFIWRPEAMCETHSCELSRNKNQMEVRNLPKHRHSFYVWDHVAVALHTEKGKVLKFDADRLRENLKFCEAGQPMITPRSDFDEFQEAENVVQVLWPNGPGALKKEMSLQDSLAEARSQSDDGKTLSSSNDGRRTESGKTTGPQTLIVGDFVITGMKGIKIKKTRVYCFPGDLVSDITERLPSLLAEHPTVKNIIVHLGATDIMKRPSEGLKQDFRDLLNALSSFDTQVFISGPLPPVRVRTERFSRLLALNKWLLTECRRPNVHFIDNFDRFWKRRRLFREDGINLSKLGLKLLISNLKSKMKSTGHFYSL